VLLVGSHILPRMTIGDINFADGGPSSQIVLVIGFVAGFLERLVPNLLERATKSPTTEPHTAAKS